MTKHTPTQPLLAHVFWIMLPATHAQVKALLRRATARDALQKYDEAEKDLRAVLAVEANNKQAREDLQVGQPCWHAATPTRRPPFTPSPPPLCNLA